MKNSTDAMKEARVIDYVHTVMLPCYMSVCYNW